MVLKGKKQKLKVLKTNSKTTLAIEKLTQIIMEQKAGGSYFLPPERQLCDQIGFSRVTLRRGLAILEERGVLVAGKNGRQITDIDLSREKPCICFCTFGHGRILLSARFRLWNNLQREAAQRGFTTRLVLYDEYNVPAVAASLSRDDYLIVTDNILNCLDPLLVNKEIRDRMIGIEASLGSRLKYMVTLDDYAVGALAAEQLLQAGYRAPGFLGLDNGTVAFQQRAAGFVDTLKASGVSPVGLKWFKATSIGIKIKELVNGFESYIHPEQDSLFVYSDEIITVIYCLLHEICNMSGNFGLITVNGSGNSVSHYPAIASISHASGRTATAILNLIEDLKNGKHKNGAVVKIKPSVHNGDRIGKKMETGPAPNAEDALPHK